MGDKYLNKKQNDQSSSEIKFTIENGKFKRTPNIIGVSGTDPVGEFIVGNVVLGKPLSFLGKKLFGFSKNIINNRYINKELNSDNTRNLILENIRSKALDRELNHGKNSNKLIHADYGNNKPGFTKGTTGATLKENKLIPGKNPKEEVNYSWWNEDKPYSYKINGKPFERFFTVDKDNTFLNVREQPYKIGQWNGKRGFVLKSEHVNSNPVEVDNAIEINPLTGYLNKVKYVK